MGARTVQLLLILSVVVLSPGAGAETPRVPDAPIDRALRFFEAFRSGDAHERLEGLRPAQISTEQLTAAVNSLPVQGELKPDAEELAKLGRVKPLLAYHARLDTVVIKVIDVPQAAVGLYAHGILLISRPALDMLTGSELEAFVAHELGHEYFWDEFYRAKARGDLRALQAVELKCDGIAALTLAELGLNIDALESGLRKVARFNGGLGATANATAYPDIEMRARFVRTVLAQSRWPGAAVPSANGPSQPR